MEIFLQWQAGLKQVRGFKSQSKSPKILQEMHFSRTKVFGIYFLVSTFLQNWRRALIPFFLCQCIKIDLYFKILLSYWLSLKSGMILLPWHCDAKSFSKKLFFKNITKIQFDILKFWKIFGSLRKKNCFQYVKDWTTFS